MIQSMQNIIKFTHEFVWIQSPHLPDPNANCVYLSQPVTLQGCFPFRTTSVALFFQNHVSVHGQGLVFSHPSNAATVKSWQRPLMRSRSPRCRCSSLDSVFFIPHLSSPHTLSNYVNIASLTCNRGVQLIAMTRVWLFPLLNYDCLPKAPLSDPPAKKKKNIFRKFLLFDGSEIPWRQSSRDVKRMVKTPSVTFRGIEHKLL